MCVCLTTNNIKSLLSNTFVKHPTTWHRQAKTEASLSSAARFSFALSVQAVPDHFAEARVVNAQGMQKCRVHARSLCYQQMKRVGSVSVGPPKNQVESVLFFGRYYVSPQQTQQIRQQFLRRCACALCMAFSNC